MIHSTKIPTVPSEKKLDQFFWKLFRLDGTDPLRFGRKFPEILVEWIAPPVSPEPPGPRTQASPAKGTGGSGDENGVTSAPLGHAPEFYLP